jgi:hypothetical protein
MKKAILIVAICIVAILVALGVIGLFSSFRAYGELKTAKNLLFSARDSLEKRDIGAAAAGFAKARDQIKKADSRLKGQKVSVGFLKIVPYAGTQIRALEHFVQVGAHLSQAGILLCGAARGVPGLDAASAQQASIGTMVDTLTRLGNDLAPVEQELLSAQQESRAMKTGWLIGPASRMKKELDQKLDVTLEGLQKGRKLMAALPGIMGAGGASPKNYMVLQQSCYELRASGGLISTYGILRCSHDSLKLAEYERSSTLPLGLANGDGFTPLPSLGGWLAFFGIAEPILDFFDAGWWPDFPETTGVLSKIWSKNGKAPVDGYIAIDPIAIQYGLEQIGPLEIPEFGETVTAENMAELILHYLEVEKNVAFLKSLASHFFEKVTGSNTDQWFSLGRAFARALAEKHMFLYFRDPAVQQSFSELDWSGEVKRSDGDYLMAVDSNVGGNDVNAYKANMWVKPKMSVEVTRRKDSTLRHHVTYTFDNTLGPKEYPFLEYKSYLRLYVPEGAVVEGAVAKAASGLVVSGTDSGKQVFGKLVDVPIGKVGTVEFDYVTPGYSSMLIQKQPGQVNMDVNFVLLEGGSIKREQKVKLINEARLDLNK